MTLVLNLRTDEAKAKINSIVFEAIAETFKEDIVPEAQRTSPVLTGTNVASIETEMKDTAKGPEATLFTTDGYGGFLEVGTKKMKAQPYLFPAFLHGMIPLMQRIYRRVNA